MWNITADTYLEKPEECLAYIKENWNKIPLLNVIPDFKLTEGELVRFFGMIQDMPDPVYYYSTYEVINNSTGSKEVRSARYRDTLETRTDETLVLDSDMCQDAEKQLFCCISIPALNTWAQPDFENTHSEIPGCSNSSKRNVEEMDVDTSEMNTDSNKRICTTSPSSEKVKQNAVSRLNFPISHPNNYSCLIHVYDDSNLQLNEIVEVCGFVHFKPLSEPLYFDDEPTNQFNLPRLHSVHLSRLNNFIPLRNIDSVKDQILAEAGRLRSELHLVLTQMLLGDSLAADYLICHLIAHIYLRKDMTVLGKFCMNLSNIPVDQHYIDCLYRLISLLLPKTHYMPLSLENVNSWNMLPVKDYKLNRLEAGVLQLSAHSHLVVDETKLEAGKLREKGIKNIQSLKCLMQHQKLDYDFIYHTVEFLTDIPVLVLSEGKSLLPSDCHVVLKTEDSFKSNSLEDNCSAVEKYLQESLLDQLRNFIATVASITDFTLPDHLHEALDLEVAHAVYSIKAQRSSQDALSHFGPPLEAATPGLIYNVVVKPTMQNDLVEQRKAGERTTAEDFHARLVLARLLSLSYGETTLSKNLWDRTGIMENDRKLRLNIQN